METAAWRLPVTVMLWSTAFPMRHGAYTMRIRSRNTTGGDCGDGGRPAPAVPLSLGSCSVIRTEYCFCASVRSTRVHILKHSSPYTYVLRAYIQYSTEWSVGSARHGKTVPHGLRAAYISIRAWSSALDSKNISKLQHLRSTLGRP